VRTAPIIRASSTHHGNVGLHPLDYTALHPSVIFILAAVGTRMSHIHSVDVVVGATKLQLVRYYQYGTRKHKVNRLQAIRRAAPAKRFAFRVLCHVIYKITLPFHLLSPRRGKQSCLVTRGACCASRYSCFETVVMQQL
jgi:hypothetical protein